MFISLIEINAELVAKFCKAAARGDVDVVAKILESGLPVDSFGEDDWTALMHAAASNQTRVISLLLQKGANVNKQNRDDASPLHWAAYTNSTNAIKMLVQLGAKTNIKNIYNQTPLDCLTGEISEDVKRLLSMGVEVPNFSYVHFLS